MYWAWVYEHEGARATFLLGAGWVAAVNVAVRLLIWSPDTLAQARFEGLSLGRVRDSDSLLIWSPATLAQARFRVLASSYARPPSIEARLAETRRGETRRDARPIQSGETRIGETRIGETRIGETRIGGTRIGEARIGEARVEFRVTACGILPFPVPKWAGRRLPHAPAIPAHSQEVKIIFPASPHPIHAASCRRMNSCRQRKNSCRLLPPHLLCPCRPPRAARLFHPPLPRSPPRRRFPRCGCRRPHTQRASHACTPPPPPLPTTRPVSPSAVRDFRWARRRGRRRAPAAAAAAAR